MGMFVHNQRYKESVQPRLDYGFKAVIFLRLRPLLACGTADSVVRVVARPTIKIDGWLQPK